MQKRQPLSAPQDVRRYFVTPRESGELCLMSCLLGENRDIFFPKLSEKLHLITFAEIAIRYLQELGFEPYPCPTEDEARARVDELSRLKKWPCYFFDSDTTGEKDFEEFYTEREVLDMNRFQNIGIVKNEPEFDSGRLDAFEAAVGAMRREGNWTKEALVELFKSMLPDFQHKETGKYLDQKM
jgi:UDP-N-acetylglucosamine 4,6-dehydratase